MNIGFVSTWMERGAAYVTKAYVDALKDNNDVYVYARGGEKFEIGNPNWDFSYVTWGYRLGGSNIDKSHFKQWILDNKLDIIFFNEQQSVEILYYIKKEMPDVIIGAYIDYYKEDMLEDFNIYDFLICNTKRHYSVFEDHPQSYYVPWGTDTDLFVPQKKNKSDKITFFHSVGMSTRKGTDALLDVFMNTDIHKKSNLIIHCQLDFEAVYQLNKKELENYNITVIEKTVTAPGLYHLGDVYVYPTTLDGLGLTLYEALACGLPVVTTDNGPMNEVINTENGYLVKVEEYHSRADAYYWPLSFVSKESLYEALDYYVKNNHRIEEFSEKARASAVENWEWADREELINDIFNNVKLLSHDVDEIKYNKMNKQRYRDVAKSIFKATPTRIQHLINSKIRNI